MRNGMIATLAAALALVSAPASAQPKVPLGPRLLLVAKKVGLSQAQVQKIRKITIAANREAIGRRAKVELARLSLQEAMDGATLPSEKKVSNLVWNLGKLETKLKQNRVLMMLRIRKAVSSAQWTKLQVLHARHKAARHRRGLQPPGPPRPPRR